MTLDERQMQREIIREVALDAESIALTAELELHFPATLPRWRSEATHDTAAAILFVVEQKAAS